jgi:energy-coupling factor transporter ATP-binding protein EcfA2
VKHVTSNKKKDGKSATVLNPFKPGKPVDPQYFGGREKELKTFEQYLQYSVSGNPHNLAILGERGIGKSSLLRKFDQIAAEERDCIVVRRELDSSIDSLSSLVIFMLEALKSEGSSHASSKRKAASKVANFFSSYKIGVSVLGHGFTLEKIDRSVAIQDYFYKELMHVWEGVKEATSGILFLIDEAEGLQNIKGSWSFLRSVFTRASEKEAGYMLVVSGKLNLFKGIKEIFSPMERFFTPLEVMPMTKEEVKETIANPIEQTLKVKVEDEAADAVFRYSGGHPYIVQTFGLFAFEEIEKAKGGEKSTTVVDSTVIQNALPSVMTRLTSQLFRDRFEQTSQLERKVLLSICKLAGSAIAEKKAVQGLTPPEIGKELGGEIKQNTIRLVLGRLVEKDCLVKKERGSYSLFTPLFSEYVRGTMSQ